MALYDVITHLVDKVIAEKEKNFILQQQLNLLQQNQQNQQNEQKKKSIN